MKREEHAHQAAYFSFLSLHEKRHPQLAMIRAIPNGGARSAITGAILKREGVRRGTPDVCIFVPANGYHGAFLEFKAAKGTLTPEQKAFRDSAGIFGYKFAVVRSFPEAVAFTNEYLGLSLKL